jgi:hypothetical protein
MSGLFDDRSLELDIDRLQTAIQDWAVGKDVWFDCGFRAESDQPELYPQALK